MLLTLLTLPGKSTCSRPQAIRTAHAAIDGNPGLACRFAAARPAQKTKPQALYARKGVGSCPNLGSP